jgi:SAM-dependent methyltransferase
VPLEVTTPSVPGMSLADAWEEHAAQWIPWARAVGFDGFWEGTWPALRSVLPTPDGPTVEVGCGEGRVSRHLAGLGHDVVAVERSPTLAHAALDGDPPVRPALADAASLPLASGCSALVVACMVLQDVDDLGGSVAEMGRVLRRGGVLCFAIVHPFASAQDPQRFGCDGPFLVDERYLTERRYVDTAIRDGTSMTFVSIHRPLSAYMDALHNAGFALEVVQEGGKGLVPWLLVGRAKKQE